MRRGTLQLTRRLWVAPAASCGLGDSAAAVVSSVNLLELVGGLPGSTASSGSRAAAVAAAAWATRPFTASAVVANDYFSGVDVGSPQRRLGQQQKQRRQVRPVDPDSDMGQLMACGGVDDMRAWREQLMAEGRFDTRQLSAAIRVLGLKEGLTPQERQAYLLELLQLGVDGTVELDGKTAAYLLWGPAKCGMRGNEPEVLAVVPIAFQFVDAMQSNDLTTVLWAMGILNIAPTDEMKEQLCTRLLSMLPDLKLKELIASGVGITRLGLPQSFAAPLVKALEVKMSENPDLHPFELDRLVKLVPFLPEVQADGVVCRVLFSELLKKAHRLGLGALAETAWAAGRLQYHLEESQIERIVSCSQTKLSQNTGVQVQTLLHGLGALQCHAGEGPVSHEFVELCVESQLGAIAGVRRGRRAVDHITRFLAALSTLHAHVPEQQLDRILEVLQDGGLQHLDKPWLAQMAFRRLKHPRGVEALEPLTNYGENQGKHKHGKR